MRAQLIWKIIIRVNLSFCVKFARIKDILCMLYRTNDHYYKANHCKDIS